MNPNEAIILSKEAEDSLRKHKFPDHAKAVALGREALERLNTMRSYGINQAVLPLPGERSIEDPGLSDDSIKRVKESPLGGK